MNDDELRMKLRYIRTNTSEASRYEQLAEECTELAHVAQKLARYLRNEQPVSDDFDPEKEKRHLLEEFADVELAFEALVGLPGGAYSVFEQILDIYDAKVDRWVDRIKEKLVKQGDC